MTRGDLVESVHHVSVVLLAPDGSVAVSAGSVDVPMLPRSALKPAQAVAVLAAGADLTDAEVALAAASHSGEPEHLAVVLGLLDRLGLGPDALGCPPDRPLGVEASRVWATREPARVAMNCSGKHAAMLAACRAGSWPLDGYLDPAHPLQRAVRAAVERLVGPVRDVTVDGCGAPAFATELIGPARLLQRMRAAAPGTPEHRVAAAMRARPDLIAGPGRLDTLLMTSLPGALSKFGAEGVLAAALPDGSALALSVADGAGRAVGPVVLELLRRRDLEISSGLLAVADPTIRGGCRPIGDHRVRT